MSNLPGRSAFISSLLAAMVLAVGIYPEARAYECEVASNLSSYPGLPPDAYMSAAQHPRNSSWGRSTRSPIQKQNTQHQCNIGGLFTKAEHTGL